MRPVGSAVVSVAHASARFVRTLALMQLDNELSVTPMPTEINAPDFDLGPLSWVQGEIDQALARGLDALAQFQAQPDRQRRRSSTRARTCTRPRARSRWSGLDAVVAFTDEIERQLARLEDARSGAKRAAALRRRRPRVPQAQDLPRRARQRRDAGAAQALSRIRGDAGRARHQGRGAHRPLLSRPQPARAAHRAARGDRRRTACRRYLVKQRRLYQRGLLAWLRGDEDGRASRCATPSRGIEDITTQGSLRAFWWTVGALFEGLVEQGLERRLRREAARGARRPADPPRRRRQRQGRRPPAARSAVLTSRSARRSGRRCRRCSAPSSSSGLIPSAEVLSADVVRLQPLLREAREQLAGAKDAWLKAASGRAENLPKLKQTLASVHAKAAEIEQRRADEAHGSAGRAPRQDAGRPACPEPLAMEYATGAAARRERVRELLEPVGRFPEAGRRDARAARRRARRAARRPRRRADARRDEQARAGARAARAGRPRDPGQPAAHGAGARRVLPRPRKRADLATLAQGQRADPRRAAHPRPRAKPDRLLELCQQQIDAVRRSRDAPVEQRRPRAARRIAVGPRLLHRSRRAAAPRPRPADRAAARQAPRRSAGARRAAEPDSVEAAVAELRAALPRARRGGAARAEPTPQRAKSSSRSSRACATTPTSSATPISWRRSTACCAELEAGDAAASQRPSTRSRTRCRARAGDLRRDAAPARHRRRASSTTSCSRSTCPRPPRCSTTSTRNHASLKRQPRRSRSAAHGAPRLPHAQGQRPHGRPHRARRLSRTKSRSIHNRLIEEERPVTAAVLR